MWRELALVDEKHPYFEKTDLRFFLMIITENLALVFTIIVVAHSARLLAAENMTADMSRHLSEFEARKYSAGLV